MALFPWWFSASYLSGTPSKDVGKKRHTRFSLLMGLAFLLLCYGITITIGKYFYSNPDLLDSVGDITRLIGLTVLLLAVFWG